jgi:cytochrome c nitrite reductase small subunit
MIAMWRATRIARARGIPYWAIAGIMALGGALVAASAFTFQYADGLTYLSNDPTACTNCHIMRDAFDGWLHGPHHTVATCNDCHVPNDSLLRKLAVKTEHGYRHSKAFTLGNFTEPIRATPSSRAVIIENCNRCHSSIGIDTTTHAHRLGASAGTDGLEGVDCLHCHAGAGHGPRR